MLDIGCGEGWLARALEAEGIRVTGIDAVPGLIERARVRTLHPVAACCDHAYLDGWRGGSWEGFAAQFTDPAPWYFRTLGNWVTLFVDNRLRLLELREPLHTKLEQPTPVIFIATPTDARRTP